MKEEKAAIPAKTQKLSWSAHPVVSTVLWMLGHDTKVSREKAAARNEENRSSALSWRDDHGGHIAEYILEIQGKPQDLSGTTENTDLSQHSTRLRTVDQTDAVVAQIRRLGLSSNPGDESPQYTTPSPQWGFYVPITPPETEMYSKAKVQQIGQATSQKS